MSSLQKEMQEICAGQCVYKHWHIQKQSLNSCHMTLMFVDNNVKQLLFLFLIYLVYKFYYPCDYTLLQQYQSKVAVNFYNTRGIWFFTTIM